MPMKPISLCTDRETRDLQEQKLLIAQGVPVPSDSDDLEDPEEVSDAITNGACRENDSCAVGRSLHRRVPAERWCVSREDFDSFVEEVRSCHVRGVILNDPDPRTGDLNPNHDNPKIGPNAHVVNKYVIKPKTLQAGGPSWALMKHEDGLPIDFFVTHNWQEGMYEFYHKVTRSWPIGLLHMWCCFLANPQAWPAEDLKHLLGSKPDLSDSPFAVALNAKCCQMMLVVPNSVESIYVRLWCVEEARRSIHLNLPVWVATDCGILHWPLKCESVQEAAKLVARNSLRRLSVWSAETVEARDGAESQLGASFTSVKDAHCTDPNDESRIRESIIGQEDVIDSMIRDLLSNGQWLPPSLKDRSPSKLPESMRTGFLEDCPDASDQMPLSRTPSVAAPGRQSECEDCLDVDSILIAAKLNSYLAAAREWCATAEVVEIFAIPVAEDMANALGLKPLERKRLLGVVLNRISLSGGRKLSVASRGSKSSQAHEDNLSHRSSKESLDYPPMISRVSSGTLRRW